MWYFSATEKEWSNILSLLTLLNKVMKYGRQVRSSSIALQGEQIPYTMRIFLILAVMAGRKATSDALEA